MPRAILATLLVGLLVGLPLSSASADETFRGRPYLIQAPDGVEKPALFVWCHPASGDPRPQFDMWKQSGIFGKQTILLCPKAAGAGWRLKKDGAYVASLIKHVIEAHDVDTSRVAMGGHSSGAIFSFDFGLRNQKLMRHLVCVAGALNWAPPRARKTSPQVTILHSTNDEVIRFEHGQKALRLLRGRGYQVELIEDSIGHAVGGKAQTAVRKLVTGWEAQK